MKNEIFTQEEKILKRKWKKPQLIALHINKTFLGPETGVDDLTGDS